MSDQDYIDFLCWIFGSLFVVISLTELTIK